MLFPGEDSRRQPGLLKDVRVSSDRPTFPRPDVLSSSRQYGYPLVRSPGELQIAFGKALRYHTHPLKKSISFCFNQRPNLCLAGLAYLGVKCLYSPQSRSHQPINLEPCGRHLLPVSSVWPGLLAGCKISGLLCPWPQLGSILHPCKGSLRVWDALHTGLASSCSYEGGSYV